MFNSIMNVLNNIVVYATVFAGPTKDVTVPGATVPNFQVNANFTTLDGIGSGIIQVISFAGILAGTTAFGFAAVIYGTANGDVKKGDSAKTQATYGAIAFACVAVAQTVKSLVFNTTGTVSGTRGLIEMFLG